MAKRSRTTTPEGIAKKIKEGFGQGHRESYKPWHTIHTVASWGKSSRPLGWKTKRVHHFLSDHEYYLYYTLEWDQNVTDIREQFPLLGQELTLDIADRLGINHPTDPKSREYDVMTTDFLVDLDVCGQTKLVAISFKELKELSSKRVIEKQTIEMIYWKEKGIDFYIVTEREIPIVLAKNVEWIHSAKDLSESPGISPNTLIQIERVLFNAVDGSNISLGQIALDVDDRLGLDPGTSLWVVRHLIANRIWIVDMNQALNPSKPLVVQQRIKLGKEVRGL